MADWRQPWPGHVDLISEAGNMRGIREASRAEPERCAEQSAAGERGQKTPKKENRHESEHGADLEWVISLGKFD